MTTSDLSTMSAQQLLALITAANERLAEIKQRHVEEAAALGLTLVDGNAAPKRKRRNSAKEQPEA